MSETLLHNRPGEVRVIHVTDRRTFKECRRQYRYWVVERLDSIDSKINALWMGSGIHHVLAKHYESKMLGQDTIDIEEEWGDYRKIKTEVPDSETESLCLGMLDGYMKFAKKEDAGWKILAVEQTFRVRVPETDIILQATIDLLVEFRGRLWIVDHKTCRAMPHQKHLEMDDQMTAYIWVLKQHGIDVAGCIYNALRKKLPAKPEILKSSGGLSKNKSIDTTYDHYLEAIQENHLPLGEYRDMLDMLSSKPNAFFQRTPILRNPKEIENFGINLVHEIKDMTSETTHFYPTPGTGCTWCTFQTLCKMEQEGSDVKFAKESLYRVRGDDER